MAQFLGKWKTNKESRKNFEEFLQKSGVPDSFAERWRNADSTLSVENSGDTWVMTLNSTTLPKPREYRFKLGEEVSTTDYQGKGVKFTAYIGNDGIWTDVSKSEIMGWKPTTTTRIVEGNKMLVTVKTEAASMSFEMDKL